jgi:hypothetical protein
MQSQAARPFNPRKFEVGVPGAANNRIRQSERLIFCGPHTQKIKKAPYPSGTFASGDCCKAFR